MERPYVEDHSPVVLLEDETTRSSRRQLGAGVILYDPSQPTFPMATHTQPKSVPILGRPSVYQIARGLHHDYQRAPPSARTSSIQDRAPPSTHASTTGAIRPGGSVKLLSRDHLGLVVAFLVVGLVDGIARALVYPLFKVYLHLTGGQQQAAATLMGFGWSCKFVFGYLSDCVPIRGQRRKPYAMLALGILTVFSAGIAAMPAIEPYMKPRGTVWNADAPSQSKRYVALVMFASFGHALLSVACEGRLVELAQRESEHARGRIQGALYLARYVGSLLAALLVALGCSSPEYGGDFSFSLSVGALLAVLAVASLAGLFAVKFHMSEDTIVLGSQPMYSRLRSLWRFAERRATWQITIVGFLQACVFSYKVPEEDTIYEQWLHGDSLTKGLFMALGFAVYAAAIAVLRSDWLRNTSWWGTLFVSTAISTVVGLVAAYLTTENVVRNAVFVMATKQVVTFCDAFPWMIGVLAIVEIAEPGFEASCYALVTTIYNLSVPIATAAASAVSSALSVDDDAIARDAASVRRRVMAHYVILYALRVAVGLGTIALLPKQKRAVQLLRQRGNPNAAVPLCVMVSFSVLFVATWVVVVSSMF